MVSTPPQATRPASASAARPASAALQQRKDGEASAQKPGGYLSALVGAAQGRPTRPVQQAAESKRAQPQEREQEDITARGTLGSVLLELLADLFASQQRDMTAMFSTMMAELKQMARESSNERREYLAIIKSLAGFGASSAAAPQQRPIWPPKSGLSAFAASAVESATTPGNPDEHNDYADASLGDAEAQASEEDEVDHKHPDKEPDDGFHVVKKRRSGKKSASTKPARRTAAVQGRRSRRPPKARSDMVREAAAAVGAPKDLVDLTAEEAAAAGPVAASNGKDEVGHGCDQADEDVANTENVPDGAVPAAPLVRQLPSEADASADLKTAEHQQQQGEEVQAVVSGEDVQQPAPEISTVTEAERQPAVETGASSGPQQPQPVAAAVERQPQLEAPPKDKQHAAPKQQHRAADNADPVATRGAASRGTAAGKVINKQTGRTNSPLIDRALGDVGMLTVPGPALAMGRGRSRGRGQNVPLLP